MESIIAAAVTGSLALVGVILTNNANQRKIDKKLEVSQAVTNCRLDELTREVREHNGFARRIPVLEEQMKVANHRISDLEERNK